MLGDERALLFSGHAALRAVRPVLLAQSQELDGEADVLLRRGVVELADLGDADLNLELLELGLLLAVRLFAEDRPDVAEGPVLAGVG